jgi:tetratricopeptide (TPR) repeat protein
MTEGKSAEALADLNAGLMRDQNNTAGRLARAELKRRMGDTAAAIDDYGAVLKQNPQDIAALRARAKALMEAKAYGKAIVDFDRVIKLDQHNAQDYYQRGLAREDAGDLKAAGLDYETALERDRKFYQARQALARVDTALRIEKPKHAAKDEGPTKDDAGTTTKVDNDGNIALHEAAIALPARNLRDDSTRYTRPPSRCRPAIFAMTRRARALAIRPSRRCHRPGRNRSARTKKSRHPRSAQNRTTRCGIACIQRRSTTATRAPCASGANMRHGCAVSARRPGAMPSASAPRHVERAPRVRATIIVPAPRSDAIRASPIFGTTAAEAAAIAP